MKFRWQISLAVFLCFAPVVTWGQTGLATITGVVSDPSGAVVANVTVSATQNATGTTVTGLTSDTGNYTIPQLRVGEYTVVIEHAGFKKFERLGIVLSASQILRLDVTLELGSTAESVTVTADSSMLQMDSGTLVTNLKPSQIQNLPLLPVGTFIRDPFALSNTVAGVLQTFTGTRVNGLGQTSIQYRLEGEILGEPGGQGTSPGITTRTQPSPDAIEEVAVLTSNIPVEFGSASGAVYNVSIKSGTNQFHGTVYDYAVNEVLNAADPATHVRNRVRRHDYGFNIGGPVKIPKLYDGTNKSFFFFNWEQYRDGQTALPTSNPTVPTDAYRNGDFSGMFAASGNTNLRFPTRDYVDPLGNTVRLGQLYNPLTEREVTCPASGSDCTPGTLVKVRNIFENNQIPATMFDPVAVATLQKYVPTPNLNGLVNNYQVPIRTTRVTTSPAVKGDQNIGSKMRLSFTFTQNKTTSPVQTLGGLAEGFPDPITRNNGTYETGPAYRLNFDYTILPTINYHLGLGYSIFNFESRPLTTNYDALADIGLRGATANKNFPLFNLVAPGVTQNPPVGGLQTLGTGGQAASPQRRPSITQTVTWVNGNHTIKMGGDFRQDMLVTQSFAGANGNYCFSVIAGNDRCTSQGATWNPALLNITGFQGNSNVGSVFANFLLGAVTNVQLSQPLSYRRSKQQWGVYIQDSWRATRNLTIDAGIRWDYGTYTREDYGRLGAFSTTEPNTSAAGHPGGLIYEATCNCNFARNYPYAIGPRFGFAYTLNPKTVVRGGVGLAYGSTPIVSGAAQNSATTPSLLGGDIAFYLREGIPASVAPQWPVYSSGQGLQPGAVGAVPTVIDPNAGRPDRTIQWNLSLQRELARDLVVEAAYVANRGVWQSTGGFQSLSAISEQTLAQYSLSIRNPDGSLNTANSGLLQQQIGNASIQSQLTAKGIGRPYSNFPGNQTVLQSLRAFPQYNGTVAASAPMGKSWYDALQVTVTKRYSYGLQLTANYTFSKNLVWNSCPDVFNCVNGKDVANGANFNPPNVFRLTFSYQTPRPSEAIPVLGNKYVAFAVKDWQISSALFYQSATYLGRPGNFNSQNPISQWLGRGPGSAQLKKNPDGSYMSPWAVNWRDLDGNIHPEPLDINCKCFDPNKQPVLNPNAWANIPDGTWGDQTQQIPFFRQSRRPTESANVARNFRMGPEGRYTLQIRVEFQNIFNRLFLPAPNLGGAGSVTTPVQRVNNDPNGSILSGFGTFGNLNNAGAYNVAGQPSQRSGQFIARFSF